MMISIATRSILPATSTVATQTSAVNNEKASPSPNSRVVMPNLNNPDSIKSFRVAFDASNSSCEKIPDKENSFKLLERNQEFKTGKRQLKGLDPTAETTLLTDEPSNFCKGFRAYDDPSIEEGTTLSVTNGKVSTLLYRLPNDKHYARFFVGKNGDGTPFVVMQVTDSKVYEKPENLEDSDFKTKAIATGKQAMNLAQTGQLKEILRKANPDFKF